MIKGVCENLKKSLDGVAGRSITIEQDGYLKSQYAIQKLKYSIGCDILVLSDEEGENGLKINLNQIYQIDAKDENIRFYMDNDSIILLKVKR